RRQRQLVERAGGLRVQERGQGTLGLVLAQDGYQGRATAAAVAVGANPYWQNFGLVADECLGTPGIDRENDGSVLQNEMGSGSRISRSETNSEPREAALPQQQASVGRAGLVDRGDGGGGTHGLEGTTAEAAGEICQA